MGRNVVMEMGTLSLLIGEKPVFSGDPSMYRTMGLEPASADIVMVKSANQFRADYEAISKRIYILDTPGSSPADIKMLTYLHIEKPFYPFDDHFEWKNPKGY
jgi:microcystin degradation protein MlrC